MNEEFEHRIIIAGVLSGTIVGGLFIGFVILMITVDRYRNGKCSRQLLNHHSEPSIDPSNKTRSTSSSQSRSNNHQSDRPQSIRLDVKKPEYQEVGRTMETDNEPSDYSYVGTDRNRFSRGFSLLGRTRRSSLQFQGQSGADNGHDNDSPKRWTMRSRPKDYGDRPNKLKPWSIKGAVQVIFPGMLSALPHRYDLQESLLETKVAEVDTPNDEDVNSKGTVQSSSIPQIQLLADSSDYSQPSEQAHYEMGDCEHNLNLNLNGVNDNETVHCSQFQVSNRATEEFILTLSSQYESFQESAPNSSCSDDEIEYASVSQVQLPPDKMLFTETLQSSSYMYVPSQQARSSGVKVRHLAQVKETLQELGKGGVKFEDQPFTPPASHPGQLYDQLARNKCIEVPMSSLVMSIRCGSGQFGDVFKGVWETPYGPRNVAMKMLKPGEKKNEKVKFLQEAAIMAQFKHPHIVELFGAVTVEEPNMLLLEFLHNGDLLRYLENQKQMLETRRVVDMVFVKQLLRFCKEIAKGMQYLSRRGYVHRDLAARNILLSNDLECKIADFGMSKDLDHEEYYISSGGRIPVKWTAPEALFYKKYSAGCDVWSFGMVMFEIWSLGHKPFPMMTVQEVIQTFYKKKGYVQPPPPGCPRAIYRLMVLCWNYDHHSRPKFEEIVVQLRDRPELLEIPKACLQGLPDPTGAKTLGAPLSCSYDMYYDLQHFYSK